MAVRELFSVSERRLRNRIAERHATRAGALATPIHASDRAAVTRRRQRAIAALVAPPTPARKMRSRVSARLIKVTDAYVAHEVEIDRGGGATVRGHLLRPRGTSKPVPAVICQHGLDGTPGDVTGLTATPDPAYHAFGARLAERGYVVFAPYLTVPSPQAELLGAAVADALAVGAMRTGFELAKLKSVIAFLGTLVEVDEDRIGYYGLSYGGYTGLWLGGLEPRLSAVVVSGHFNDWTTKLTDDRHDTSFLRHPDEDFTIWRGLELATHAELVAAMYPRPVLIEWADGDATTIPEWHHAAWREVGSWAAAWDVDDRVERTAFTGVHEIGGRTVVRVPRSMVAAGDPLWPVVRVSIDARARPRWHFGPRR